MANPKEHLTHITTRLGVSGAIVRAVIWLAFIGLGLWFLTRIQFTLTIFGLAWLIAYLMNPLVEKMEGRKLWHIEKCSRGLAVGGIYFCVLSLLFLAGSLLFPTVAGQIHRLIELQHGLYNSELLASSVQEQGEKLVRMLPEEYRAQLLEKLRASLGTITTEIGKFISSALSHLASFFGQMLTGAVILLSALLISIYIILSWKDLGATFVESFPHQYRSEIDRLMGQMNRIFGGYLRATILTSLAAGCSTTICLWIYSFVTGVSCPYSYVIGIIAGLAYPIPLFGILSSTLVAAVLGFFPESDFHTALWVGGIVFVVNNLIDRTLQPKLMSSAIGVSPLFVIFAAAAGGEFIGGVWGMLAGIPLAAMTKAFTTWVHELFLEDESESTEGTLEAVAVVVPVVADSVVQPDESGPSANIS
jgi:predicted PurR-regulated permease PerM